MTNFDLIVTGNQPLDIFGGELSWEETEKLDNEKIWEQLKQVSVRQAFQNGSACRRTKKPEKLIPLPSVRWKRKT